MKSLSTKWIIILAGIIVLGCGALGAGAGLTYWLVFTPPAAQFTTQVYATATALPKPVSFKSADTPTPTATHKRPTATPRPTSTPRPTATPTQPPSPTSPKGDGYYLVGDEIAVGKWRSTGKGNNCYWERLDENQEILDNNFGMSGGVMTIQPGDFIVSMRNCGTWQYMDNPSTAQTKPEPPKPHPAPLTDVTVCQVQLNDDFLGKYVQWTGWIMDEFPGQNFQVWWENPVEGTDCDYKAFFVVYSGTETLYGNDTVQITGEIIDTKYEYAGGGGSRQYGVVVRADDLQILNKPTP